MCNPHHMVDDLSKYHIYVGNLGQDVNVNLFTMFEEYDPIGHRLIMSDGESRGFGFVAFQGLKNAKKAVKAMHGKTLPNGNTLCVRLVESNSVLVTNLHEKIDKNELKKIFTRCGTVKFVSIIINDRGIYKGLSSGRAIVCFTTEKGASCAINVMNGQIVHGKRLQVEAKIPENKRKHNMFEELIRKSRMKSQHLTSYRRLSLYVKNLDDTIDDERLRKEFAPYGTITSAKVILDEGRSKGFGFVCFSALDEATKAVTEMNGRIVGSKPLYVALAQRKEECKSHLASQYIQRVNSLRMQHIGQVYQQGGTDNQNVAGPSKYQPKNPSVKTPPSSQPIGHVDDVTDFASVKQSLANRLLSLIRGMLSIDACEIIEILLELDNQELALLADNKILLKEKVNEAASLIEVIKTLDLE